MITSPGFILAALTDATQIPGADPLGFPLPAWILQVLAYLLLVFHLLAMNFTIGGILLYFWIRSRREPGYESAAYFFGSSFPLGVSYIITLGIPPLLFLQVLYGQLFYSSSVLLGSFWIQVIPVMILAYTGFYYHKFSRAGRPHLQRLVVGLAGLLLLYIGFIYVNNLTLAMSPEKWLDLYSSHPGGGILMHGEPSIFPRFLLFLSGSFAAAGVSLIWRGEFLHRWGFNNEAEWSRSLGFRSFLLSPMIWIIAAGGVYLTRPEDIAHMWQSVGATPVLFITGLVFGLIAVAAAWRATAKRGLLLPFLSSLGIVGAMACMVVFRDLVRIESLQPHFTLSAIPVNTQWGMFLLFTVTLVAGLTLLVVLSIRVFPQIAEKSRERLSSSASEAQAINQ